MRRDGAAQPLGRAWVPALWAFAVVVTITVAARASTVVLVRSPHPTAAAAEATVRLRGELVSAGFEVRVIDPPLDRDVRMSLEQAAAGPDVEAVVAILGGASGHDAEDSAELWVIDRVTGKTVVRRVPNQAGSARGAEVLSIRALELLRASFLEVAMAAGRAPRIVPQPPPQEVTRWTDDALADAMDSRWPSTWAVEAGGCVLGSFEGMSPSLMALARLQRAFGEQYRGRITAAGLGTQPRLTTPSGTAEVAHQIGLLEGAVRLLADHRMQPFFSVGLGAVHVMTAGQTSLPLEGISQSRWSLLADVGVGAHVVFRGRFELALELHAQVATPYPVVRYLQEAVAREGRPTVFGSLSLLAWM